MSLNDFLDGKSSLRAHPGSKCSICKNPKYGEEVEEYVKGVQDGTIQHSQNYIWQHYFAPTYGTKSSNTLRHHIRLCLGIDL